MTSWPAATSPPSGKASSPTAGPAASRPRKTSGSASISTPIFPSATGSRFGSSRAKSIASSPASRPKDWPTPSATPTRRRKARPPLPTAPLAPEAAKASAIVNRFLDDVAAVLKAEAKANAALLRGFSKFPSIPTMQTLFKLRPAAIANYPMYRGLAKLLGMEVIGVGAETADLFDALEKNWADHDFFYVHYKKTDSTGEDGKFGAKVAAIEALDPFLPRLAALRPDVLVVTSDHSTPSCLKGHSWHPNPFLLVSPTAGADDVAAFTERACAKGMLGRFRSISAMPLMLAHALKLQKYGA